MDAVFAAINITSLATSVTTLVVGFVGVGLIFLGWKYAKRVMRGA